MWDLATIDAKHEAVDQNYRKQCAKRMYQECLVVLEDFQPVFVEESHLLEALEATCGVKYGLREMRKQEPNYTI